MSPVLVLALSVLVYAAFPLLCALVRGPSRTLLLYTHLAAVLTLGSFLGSIYLVEVGGGVVIPAGQISYAAYMFTTLVTVVVGRDVRVVRHVILLTAGVNSVAFLVLVIGQRGLAGGRLIDPFGVPTELFNDSLRVLVVGTLLSILELLALLALLEAGKKRLSARPMAPVYVLAFLAILLADGLLFPVLVHPPEAGLAGAITNGVQAKALLAGAFAVPLTVFVAAYRPVLSRYEATTLRLREVVLLSTADLLGDLDRLEQDIAEHRDRLARDRAETGRATATATGLLDAAAHTVIIVADERGRILRSSSGARRTTDLDATELRGMDLLDLLEPAEIPRLTEVLGVPGHLRHHPTALLDSWAQDGERRECRVRRWSAESRTVALGVTELVSTGVPIGYLASGEDVTERVRARSALRTAMDREQRAAVRLHEVERFQDELIRTVSHELRTPITSMTGFLEMIVGGAYGDLSPELTGALVRVLRNTSRLESLVDDLMVLARDQPTTVPLDLVDLDLRDVLAEAERLLPTVVAGSTVRVRIDPGSDPVPVRGDAAALERVLLNLLSNAIKFTDGEGTVDVLARPGGPGEAVAGRLVVRDTGIGIEDAALGSLFRRFYRAPAAHERAVPGTGLGLSIVESVVAAHGGHVDVVSAVGQGTTVTVLLPMDPAVPGQRGAAERAPTSSG